MKVIRPICSADLDVLHQIAIDTGPGFTSLPDNRELLAERIQASEDAFSRPIEQCEPLHYLLVMEETDTGEVVGTCGIDAAVGLNAPFYHYRIGTVVHASRELNVHNSFRTLYLCNDYTGCSEMCTLYLQPDARHSANGSLLSKSRFLFMAEHPQRFADKVIAELRGFTDEQGHSPFWDGLGKRFFSMEYHTADYLTGSGNKVFIAELMPKHSLYIHLLPESAQAVIGKVHPNTEPARAMLESEGFRYEEYVDIFDGGPTLAIRLADIRAIRHSRYQKVAIGDVPADGPEFLISNTGLTDFRCTKATLTSSGGIATIDADTAAALQVNAGDPLRIVELKRRPL
mgnify:CR=1 FL=1